MKGLIHYVENHIESENQAEQCYQSFIQHNVQVEKRSGITPKTLQKTKYSFKDLDGGRLKTFEEPKYYIKKSCALNHIKFAETVIEHNNPMLFIEHDAICVAPINDIDFEDYVYMAIEYWNKPPSELHYVQGFSKYHMNFKDGVNDFPKDFPLKYYKNSIYKGYIMTPGTICYALSPVGAKKILHAAYTYGLDQSDFMINNKVVRLQYLYPSPVKFNKNNLNLSHALDLPDSYKIRNH